MNLDSKLENSKSCKQSKLALNIPTQNSLSWYLRS